MPAECDAEESVTPDIEQVQITHCCNMTCLMNSDGILDRCPRCGSSYANYWLLWRCLVCGRDFEQDDRAEECWLEHQEPAPAEEAQA